MRKYKGSTRAKAINVFIAHAIHGIKLKYFLVDANIFIA